MKNPSRCCRHYLKISLYHHDYNFLHRKFHTKFVYILMIYHHNYFTFPVTMPHKLSLNWFAAVTMLLFQDIWKRTWTKGAISWCFTIQNFRTLCYVALASLPPLKFMWLTCYYTWQSWWHDIYTCNSPFPAAPTHVLPHVGRLATEAVPEPQWTL